MLCRLWLLFWLRRSKKPIDYTACKSLRHCLGKKPFSHPYSLNTGVVKWNWPTEQLFIIMHHVSRNGGKPACWKPEEREYRVDRESRSYLSTSCDEERSNWHRGTYTSQNKAACVIVNLALCFSSIILHLFTKLSYYIFYMWNTCKSQNS